jgi:hypothetical protein
MINLTFQNFEECKEYMKALLEKTDYVCLADVQDQLENYQVLVGYRESVRYYFLNPVFTVSLLEEPAPIWK